jgi:dolichol-phosphate mannosyltransferase
MADQSDDPLDLVKCYGKIGEGYDCVFGTRFNQQSTVEKYPIGKLIVNRVVNRLIQLMFWTKHNDLTNAFKVYRASVIRECGPYTSSHFNITIEMSLSALIRGYSIASVPINWYGRTWGVSNLRVTQMGRRYLAVLLKLFCERLLIADDLVAERLARQLSENSGRAKLEKRVAALEKKLRNLEGRPSQDVG